MKIPHRYLLVIAATALFLGAARVLPVSEWMLAALRQVEAMGAWGPGLFLLLYVPACLTLFPDVILNMAAGLLWGVGLGTLIVSAGRVLGATITFCLVRRLADGWQRRRVEADPRLAAIARAVDRDGFKIALMLRLCPLFPLPLFHVVLALTRIPWWTFALTTLLGALPRTLVAAYLGSGARSLAALASGAPPPALPLWVFWSGLLITLAVAWWITRFARRTLREAAAV